MGWQRADTRRQTVSTDRDNVAPVRISGFLVVEWPTKDDERGFFREVERRADVETALDRSLEHRQWNHARSIKGVLRGIHVATWTKCVYVVRGEAQVVGVDLRRESETFGIHEEFVVGDSRRAMVVIPPGCGLSYLVLSDVVDLIYSVDEEWRPDAEFGVTWDDPDLAIPWRLVGQPILSERDTSLPRARELFPDKFAAKTKGEH